MNSRQGALLRALLEASDYRTSADYARRLGCSDRTIRTDVKALNAFFEHEGFATRVGRQRGAGLRLSLVPDEENRLVRLLEESETEMHPRYERLCQEMIALTCHPGPHTAESLARRMFRNKQQIQSDLRWWQGMLEVSGLSLSVGRQITVEGPEWTIRGFVMSMLFSFSTAAVRRRILPSLFGTIDPYDRQFLERCIAEMQRDLGFEFSSNAQWQFGVYLCIMVTRIRLGYGLTSWRGADGATPFFAYLKKRLERHFSLAVSDAEMGLLRDMAHCCTWQWSLAAMEAYEPGERARAVTDDIASALENAFGLPLPEDLRKPLAILFESGLARRTCGLVAPNPNEEAVKYETMDGACLLASVLCEVPSLVEADLFSPDYARIALVLLDYLDQAGALRCYRVGLVVNCGIDLALWGEPSQGDRRADGKRGARRRGASELDAARALRLPRLVRAAGCRFPQRDRVPGCQPQRRRPYHRLGAALAAGPGGAHRVGAGDALGGILPESLFGSLHERLSADGLIDMPPARFERLVWTLSVVKDRTLVFAWCGLGVRRTGIRIYRLEEGEGAECGQCTMAAVLVAAPGDRADLTPLTQGFKRLVEDYADTSDLVSDDGFFVCFPEPE